MCISDINSLANTTITKVPAVRAITAKTHETNMPHGMGPGMKHDDYPPGYGGSSALLDTYLQYIGENMFGEFTTYIKLNCDTYVTSYLMASLNQTKVK